MLHIILLILKILGIIFLIILGILLLVLYSVLFVAAAYRIRIQKQDAFRISGDAGWLFRIITIHFSLDGKNGWKKELQIWLFGFQIKKPFEEKKPKKQKRRRLKKNTVPENSPASAAPEHVPEPEEEVKDQDPYNFPEDLSDRFRSEPKQPVRPPRQHEGAGQQRRAKKQRHRPSPLKKLQTFFRKLVYASKGICDKIREKITEAGDTIRRLLQRKDALLEFWKLEEHRRARGAVFKEVQYLWKKSRPKKIQGKVTFGFQDPFITGICLGGMSMLYAWYPDRLELAPDFEQEILEGDILMRGKVRFYVLVCILWRIYFNQDIRHMYEHWKQL